MPWSHSSAGLEAWDRPKWKRWFWSKLIYYVNSPNPNKTETQQNVPPRPGGNKLSSSVLNQYVCSPELPKKHSWTFVLTHKCIIQLTGRPLESKTRTPIGHTPATFALRFLKPYSSKGFLGNAQNMLRNSPAPHHRELRRPSFVSVGMGGCRRKFGKAMIIQMVSGSINLSNPKPSHPTGAELLRSNTTRPFLLRSKLAKKTVLDFSAEAQTY